MKVKQIPFKDAMEAVKAADKVLQEAKTPADKRKAAIAFAKCDRDAKSAKKREAGDSDGSILDAPAGKKE